MSWIMSAGHLVGKNAVGSNALGLERLHLHIKGLLAGGDAGIPKESYGKNCPLNRFIDLESIMLRVYELIDGLKGGPYDVHKLIIS
jgi:hypothetical protein